MTHLSTTDTAKEIRIVLKRTFPRTKFSVKSKFYSGGSSITVDWTDGPCTAQVNPIVKRFEGSSFDGMTDLKSYNGPSLLNGEAVTFGTDYVFTNRHISTANNLAIASSVCRKLGIEIDPADALTGNQRVCGYLGINQFDTDIDFGLSFTEVLSRTNKCIGGDQEWLATFIYRVGHYISYEFSVPPESLPQDVDKVLSAIEALCV